MKNFTGKRYINDNIIHITIHDSVLHALKFYRKVNIILYKFFIELKIKLFVKKKYGKTLDRMISNSMLYWNFVISFNSIINF